MIDVFIHKLIGEDLSELKISEMYVSASYNLVTQPFFATVPRKHHCPSSSMDFPVFFRQCGIYLVKPFCYGIAYVLVIA